MGHVLTSFFYPGLCSGPLFGHLSQSNRPTQLQIALKVLNALHTLTLSAISELLSMSDFYSTWKKNYDFNWSLPWQCDLVGHEPSICTAESALGGRLTRGLPLAFTLHFWFNVHVSADQKKQRVKRTVHLSCRVYSTGWESKAVDWKKKKTLQLNSACLSCHDSSR